MTLPAPVEVHVKRALQAKTLAVRPVAGGSIHRAVRVDTGSRQAFLKFGQGPAIRRSLHDEADGLRRLAALDGVRVPDVLAAGEHEDWAWLLLPWIEPGNAPLDTACGQLVASLHAHPAERWGLDRDNSIALLVQENAPMEDGNAFWAERRLLAGARMAHDAGALPGDARRSIETLAHRLVAGELGQPREPCWLHGDLWCGNVLVDAHGEPWLIDPAVHAGDPRVDLAMTGLFGGFRKGFRQAWEERHGTREDDALREQVYVVWPLLVHAALFGASYGTQAGAAAAQALRLA